MRWPWQPRPGIVRVGKRRLIELQRNALRSMELEQQISGARAEGRALELINEQCEAYGVPAADLSPLAGDLPLTLDGLHERAFLALLERRVWECQMDAALAAPAKGDDG